MTIRTLLAPLPTPAIGMVLRRYYLWAGSAENWGGDGDCQFSDEMTYFLPACFFFTVTVFSLIRGLIAGLRHGRTRPEVPQGE